MQFTIALTFLIISTCIMFFGVFLAVIGVSTVLSPSFPSFTPLVMSLFFLSGGCGLLDQALTYCKKKTTIPIKLINIIQFIIALTFPIISICFVLFGVFLAVIGVLTVLNSSFPSFTPFIMSLLFLSGGSFVLYNSLNYCKVKWANVKID